MKASHLFHAIVMSYLLCANCTEIDLSLSEKFKEGENHYNNLVGKVAPYGECWKAALQELHLGCKHLTEDVQSRLALSFANCFLKHSLTIECFCPKYSHISDCLIKCPKEVFPTYREFFTHTQSICHYLQHREWQEQTEKTVILLTESADSVSKKLDASSESQSKIINLQQISLQEQQKLITNGKTLSSELQISRSHARELFEDFKSTTKEHRHLIFEIFDRIKALQSFVLGEFTNVFTIAYYIVGIIMIYILTSVHRTANARIWLLIILSANAVFEKILASYSLDEELTKLLPLDVNGPVFVKIWVCRKITSVIALGVLLYFYYTFEDYNMINNKLLKEIQQQNADIQVLLQSVKLGKLKSSPQDTSKLEALSDLQKKIKITAETCGGKIYEDEYSSKSHIQMPVHQKDDVLLKESSKAAKNSLERTPKKSLKYIKKNSTPSPNISALQELQENISFEEGNSGQKRYNLRSRTNSPVSPFFAQQALAGVKLSFGNRL
ncbi:uncharacterized protein [Parasteatoda tepidariorum]|uniref:uncharacterized protein isoform X2 n=1 Tax=Parasteatoda tepidariorum TaxID=114398 RepID=UPI0039BD1462